MALKDKLVTLEDLKIVHDEAVDLKSALNDTVYNLSGTENLFDSSDTSEGRLGANGDFVSMSGYFTSAYIPVSAGKTYYKNSPKADAYHRICAYKTLAHTVTDFVVSDSNFITIPSGYAYVRFCGIDSEASGTQLWEVSATDTTARNSINALENTVGYGFLHGSDYSGDVDEAGAGWIRVVQNATHSPDPVGGFILTAERADGSKIQLFVNNDINHGTKKARFLFRYKRGTTWSEWVEPVTEPFVNETDYSGDLNDFTDGVTRVLTTATNIPTNQLGFCIAVKRAASALMQLFVAPDGDIYSRVKASGTFTPWVKSTGGNTEARLHGATGYTFGDSIMAQDGLVFSTYYTQNAQYNIDKLSQTCKGYQSWLRQKYDVTITDYAVGGQGIVAQLPIIKAQNYTNVDFVIISTGTNDYSGARTMGTLPTSADAVLDETTFIGAYCSALKYIKTQNPEIKILLMTPLHRDTKWRNDGEPDFSKSATDIFTLNSKNLKLVDYRNAICDIGELFSCVVCDMYAESGFNLYDLPTYTFEGVHPTNEGYEYIVPVLFRAFEKL